LNRERLNREADALAQRLLTNNLVVLLPGEMEKLERKTVPDTCPICLGDYENGAEIVFLRRCQHDFHRECVTAWFRKTPMCPKYRNNVASGVNNDGQQSQNDAYRGLQDVENPQ